MKYPRYAYNDSTVAKTHVKLPYSTKEMDIPKFDYPISPRENLKRAIARNNPVWVPNSFSDTQTLGAQDVVTEKVRGMQIHTDFRHKATGDYTFRDWFNTDWTWVQSAMGAMLTPGTCLMEDVTEWERVIEWPNLSEWDFEETAARFLKDEHDPNKALNIDLGRGCTERLISLVGGYTEGMLAMAVEPEAVSALLDRYADHVIALFDKLHALYPLDMVTYHDDWGTERDTFFSEKMMEELVFNPTKRIVDHIRSKGVAFMMHSCGNITRFVPYMIDFGADMLQIQRRAVDIPALKRKYGDKIGFNAGLEGYEFGAKISNEQVIKLIRGSVDIYAEHGGYLAALFMSDPEQLWIALNELYAYSREYYESK